MKKAVILFSFSLHLTSISAQIFDDNPIIPKGRDFEMSFFEPMLTLPEFKPDLNFYGSFKPESEKFQLIDFNDNIFNHISSINRINNRSWFTFSSDYSVYTTLGYTNMVSGKYSFKLNNYITLSTGIYVGKYCIDNYLTNDAGINGNIKFALLDRLALHVSGRYSFNNMQSVFGSSMFPQTGLGGAFEYKINDVWGIEFGTRYEYDVIQQKWVLIPYVSPVFYKSLLAVLGLKESRRKPILKDSDLY